VKFKSSLNYLQDLVQCNAMQMVVILFCLENGEKKRTYSVQMQLGFLSTYFNLQLVESKDAKPKNTEG
jgi:hypothetical protein